MKLTNFSILKISLGNRGSNYLSELVCITGFIYNILLYARETTFYQHSFADLEECHFGLYQTLVIALWKTIPDPIHSVFYFDNGFTSVKLINYLRKEFGILSLLTMMKNRTQNCDLLHDKVL